jgi:predicted MPP superfamily phosphohydrolase
MSDDFIILHLSDTHIGNPKHVPDSDVVLNPLLDDLRVWSNDFGKPNLIIFSGDLAYGEIPETKLTSQYDQAASWITKMYDSLGTSQSETPLFLVPGNHDLNDTKVGQDQIDWVRKLENDSGVNEVYSRMQANGIEWIRMLERQNEWCDFLRSRSLPWNINTAINFSTGKMNHAGRTIGIVGLNSSWAASPPPRFPNTDGMLWIGKYQLNLALKEIDGADFKIAVAHHPADWLNTGERRWMAEKIESNFQVFLHGHDHSQWFQESPTHLMIAAGACYQGSIKENAYSWLRLNLHRSKASINLRTYSDKGAGGWIPYHIPGKTDERGFASLIFPSKSSSRGRGSKSISKRKKPRTVTKSISFPNTGQDYLTSLQTLFGFRWETSSFRDFSNRPVVCWPIRLRQPTPIHAVQCFAAAGLQRVGCEIVLFIDDLGNKDYSVEEFQKTLRRWINTAKGDDTKLTLYECSELLEQNAAADIWTQVKQWLGTTTYPLEKVLRVSKLIRPQQGSISFEELGKKRPRRLLTPAVVWTCLLYLHRMEKLRPLITLAGNDEVPLWQAWRECSNEPDIKVGHLYVPELTQQAPEGTKAVHMSETDLAWESREDIEAALAKELSNVTESEDWTDPHRLIPWCFRQCVLFPIWLSGASEEFVIGNSSISKVEQLKDVNHDELKSALVEALNRWLL